MTISPAAASAAPQAPAALPTAASSHDSGDAQAGFAQALIQAVCENRAPALPDAPACRTQLSAGSPRTSKDPKQPSKTEDKNAIAAAVTTPQPATPALPLWIQWFSRENAGQPQPSKESRRQASADSTTKDAALPTGAPVAAQAAGAAAKAVAETSSPVAALAVATDSAHAASKPPGPESPQSAPAGDLAFAARMQPDQAAGVKAAVQSQPAPHDLAALAPAVARKVAASDAANPTAVTAVAAGAGASLASYGQGSANQPDSALPAASSESAAPSPVEAQFTPRIQPKPATAPVKDISIQVTQPGAQKVEVRVVQQSGELRVAVRTGDSDLAHGLQQSLSDLVGRLQETGFRGEAWRPGGTTAPSAPVVESHASASGAQNGDSHSFAGGSSQQDGGQRQNQSQQRPAWVEELDHSIASGEQSQGVSYGIGS